MSTLPLLYYTHAEVVMPEESSTRSGKLGPQIRMDPAVFEELTAQDRDFKAAV